MSIRVIYFDFNEGLLDCWKGYLILEVKEKKKVIGCPGTDAKRKKCTTVVDELTYVYLLT